MAEGIYFKPEMAFGFPQTSRSLYPNKGFARIMDISLHIPFDAWFST
jgi:hypothetical protein